MCVGVSASASASAYGATARGRNTAGTFWQGQEKARDGSWLCAVGWQAAVVTAHSTTTRTYRSTCETAWTHAILKEALRTKGPATTGRRRRGSGSRFGSGGGGGCGGGSGRSRLFILAVRRRLVRPLHGCIPSHRRVGHLAPLPTLVLQAHSLLVLVLVLVLVLIRQWVVAQCSTSS